MSYSDRPKGGGGGMTVGSSVSGAENLAILRVDSSGNLEADADKLSLDNSGRVSINRASPLTSMHGGNYPLLQVHGSTANDTLLIGLAQNAVNGTGAFAASANSGATVKLLAYALASGGSGIRSNAATAALTADKPIQIYTTGANDLPLGTNGVERAHIDASGNVVVGTAALATTATDGFLYIPTCAGTPTGAPTAKAGRVPIIFDTTANKIWVYDGAWLQTVALT